MDGIISGSADRHRRGRSAAACRPTVFKPTNLAGLHAAANTRIQDCPFMMAGLIVMQSSLRGLISNSDADWLFERIDDHNAANISAVIHIFRIQLLAAQSAR